MRTHKPRFAGLLLAGLTLSAFPSTTWAQADSARSVVTVGRFLSLAGAASVYAMPSLLGINQGPAGCAPCDPATVPFFDRWAITPERPGVSHASTFVLIGLAAGTWADMSWRAGDRGEGMMASLEAAAWASAVTELGKHLFARNRPILYTELASLDGSSSDRRSLPSGHTSTAFALATSYALTSWDRGERLPVYLALGAATTVGVLRVVAGRHFPSDVVLGAAVGMGSALIVHEIRF